MTPVVGRIVLITVAVFLLTVPQPELAEVLALRPALLPSRPWTAISYVLVHAGFMHIFFNMLLLFFFGPRVELRLGGRRFFILYLVAGLVGAALSYTSDPRTSIVGASGSVLGVMFAFAWYWPRELIYPFGLFPVQARYLIAIYAILDIVGHFGGQGNTAYLAHLGGLLGGFVCTLWFGRRGAVSRAIAPKIKVLAHGKRDLERWRNIPRDDLHPINQKEFDRLLAKIEDEGLSSLNARERAFLDRFSASA